MRRNAGASVPTAACTPWPLHLAVPLVVFALVVLMGLWADAFQYDTDEGLNLMKAVLVAQGHVLYREVWSDQPPLHTLLLAGVFTLFGPSVTAGRVLTAAFSALLAAAVYDLIRRSVSTRAGLIAVGLLLTAAWYPKLSFSTMIGLPALALATASLALGARSVLPTRRERVSWPLLALSASLMAAAVAVKLFAALVIVPGAVLLWILLAHRGAPALKVAGAIVAWLAMLVAACGAVALLTQPSPDALLGSHVAAWQHQPWHRTLAAGRVMRRDWDLLLLSLVACVMCLRDTGGRRPDILVPAVWFVAAGVALQVHGPVWYHHGLILVVPAAWMSAVVLDDVVQRRSRLGGAGAGRRGLGGMITALLVGFLAWQVGKAATSIHRMFASNRTGARLLVEEMRRHAPQTTWVFADRPIYPFAAGLVVPPEVAVVSTKRRETGNLSDEQVVAVLERYRPEQILLARLEFGPPVTEYVSRHYRPARQGVAGRPVTLYLHEDIFLPERMGQEPSDGR